MGLFPPQGWKPTRDKLQEKEVDEVLLVNFSGLLRQFQNDPLQKGASTLGGSLAGSP